MTVTDSSCHDLSCHANLVATESQLGDYPIGPGSTERGKEDRMYALTLIAQDYSSDSCASDEHCCA